MSSIPKKKDDASVLTIFFSLSWSSHFTINMSAKEDCEEAKGSNPNLNSLQELAEVRRQLTTLSEEQGTISTNLGSIDNALAGVSEAQKEVKSDLQHAIVELLDLKPFSGLKGGLQGPADASESMNIIPHPRRAAKKRADGRSKRMKVSIASILI